MEKFQKMKAALRMTKSFAAKPTVVDSSFTKEDSFGSPEYPPTASQSLSTFSSVEDVEAFEKSTRQRKEVSFVIRLMKIRYLAMLEYLQALHLVHLSYKRLWLVEDYEPHERQTIFFEEERTFLRFVAYLDLAHVVDEARRHLLQGEILSLARFQASMKLSQQQLRLANDEMTDRHELEHDYWNWWFWYYAEFAFECKLIQTVVNTRELNYTANILVGEILEIHCRCALKGQEEIRIVLGLSSMILKAFEAHGSSAVENTTSILQSRYNKFIGPVLLLRRVSDSYRQRQRMWKLHLSDLPNRRKRSSVILMHKIVKGYFTRKVFFLNRQMLIRISRCAVNTVHRVVIGFFARKDMKRRQKMASEIFEIRHRNIQDREQMGREKLQNQEVQDRATLSWQFDAQMQAEAVCVLHRAAAGFVTRVDLFLFCQYGPNPHRKVRGRKEAIALSSALDWHSMAQHHHLWDGGLCDRHL